jgi:hypothetical protein
MKTNTVYISVLLTLLVLSINDALAQWSWDPSINTPVSVVPKNQVEVALVNNNEGNIFVSWTDYRENSDNADIYIQSINSNGEVRWTSNGIPVKIDSLFSGLTRIVDDGTGGVILIWTESFVFNYNRIVAQRIDANGNLMWNTDGVVLSQLTHPINHAEFKPVTDGSGGIYFAWVTNSGGIENDIFCQRVGNNGQLIWGTPVTVCNLPGSQFVISIDSDKQGGILITWSDDRSGNMDIYAQRLDPSGNILWGLNGTVVCNESSNQGNSKITVDELGNSFITWEDRRNSAIWVDIYAQKLNSDANYFWISNGVAVCSLTSSVQTKPVIAADNLGGAIVAWTDFRNGSEDIYAQRISSTGNDLWTSNGIPISTRTAPQEGNINIVSDNFGGVIMCWEIFLGGYDLLAQRVDANGTLQWAQDGIYVCNATGNQRTHQIALDEDDNLFACWQDSRNGTDNDIYIQRVNNDGTLGNPTNLEETAFSLKDFDLYQNYPNPFNPTTTINYTIPSVTLSRVEGSRVQLKVYDVLGNEIATLVNEEKSAGNYQVSFNASQLSSGIYFYKLQSESFVETKKMILLR